MKYVIEKNSNQYNLMGGKGTALAKIGMAIDNIPEWFAVSSEGFNIQKNGTFNIGHLYSKDSTSIKVHYLMIQIAHIIRQLLENGIKEIKELKLKLKEISQHIKTTLISTITNLMVHKKVQLRFD